MSKINFSKLVKIFILLITILLVLQFSCGIFLSNPRPAKAISTYTTDDNSTMVNVAPQYEAGITTLGAETANVSVWPIYLLLGFALLVFIFFLYMIAK